MFLSSFKSLKFEAGRNFDIRISCGRWLSQVRAIHVIDPCHSLDVHRRLSLWIGPIMESDNINNTSVSRVSIPAIMLIVNYKQLLQENLLNWSHL